MSADDGWDAGRVERTVIPSRIWGASGEESIVRLRACKANARCLTLQGVFGMALTTLVEDGTHACNCEIVEPARMEMTSLPSSADAIPSSVRIFSAS